MGVYDAWKIEYFKKIKGFDGLNQWIRLIIWNWYYF